MKIYLEANIGAGKSTLLNTLKNSNFNNYNKIEFLQEPVNEWENLKDEQNVNILENFYKDQIKWSFPFQMNSFISRAHKMETTKYDHILSERSVYTDKFCFAENCFENKKMNKIEWDIYSNWHDWLVSKFKLEADAYIYLRTEPKICYERIKKRTRSGESDIPLDYLETLHKKHESWMQNESEKGIPIFTINGNCNIEDSNYYSNIDNIIEFINHICDQK